MTSATTPAMIPATPGDDTMIAETRCTYINEAESVGSIPLPGTVTGAIATGAQILTGNDPSLRLDKLGERLVFERTGTHLYEALITKFEVLQDNSTSMTLADLQQIRQDKARHFAIVAEAITSMGGDPTAQTPCADQAGVESVGLMQAVTDPRTTNAQSLHAILVAEMVDNASWEMLIALAEDQGQGTMITDFTVALDEERTHLSLVQRWLEEATLGYAISNGVSIDDVSDANTS